MADWSFNSSDATFERDVLEASAGVLVLVDFWAPWCGPCRALTPTLEKLVAEFGGRFLLAKVNVDENPNLAARYGVRGIPNVKAFVAGRVANEFTGALPESGVRRFLESVFPSPGEMLRVAAEDDIARGDLDAARAKLREALASEPENHAARLDLADLLVAQEDCAGAEEVLGALPDYELDERGKTLAARIGLWKNAQSLPDLAILRAQVDASPGDLETRLSYADRLAAAGRYRAALDEFLEVVRRDRGERRERARKAAVNVFTLAPDQPELVSEYRRKLASALY